MQHELLSKDFFFIKDLTCITLSIKPHTREDIGQIPYVNYNSVFRNEADQHKATLEALKLVNTEFSIICDDDDPFPDYVIMPNKSLVYGDFYCNSKTGLMKLESRQWDSKIHLNDYWLIHKPIIRTDLALKVLKNVPIMNLHFHYWFYCTLANIYGSEYNKQLKIIWNKNSLTSHHSVTNKLKSITKEWLIDNSDLIKNRILNL